MAVWHGRADLGIVTVSTQHVLHREALHASPPITVAHLPLAVFHKCSATQLFLLESRAEYEPGNLGLSATPAAYLDQIAW